MEKKRPHYIIDGILVTVDPDLNQDAAVTYAKAVIATRMHCCLSIDTIGSKPEQRNISVFYHSLPGTLQMIESGKPYKLTTLSNGKQLRVYPYGQATIEDIDNDVLEYVRKYAEGAISIDKDPCTDEWGWED